MKREPSSTNRPSPMLPPFIIEQIRQREQRERERREGEIRPRLELPIVERPPRKRPQADEAEDDKNRGVIILDIA